MAISNPGGNLNSVPSSRKQTLSTNYIDFTAGTNDWRKKLKFLETELLVVFLSKLVQKSL